MKSKKTLLEYRELSPEALGSKIMEMEETLLKLRFKKASSQVENTTQLRTIRRNIARARTVLRQQANLV